MRSLCAKVPKSKGDDLRKALLDAQFVDRRLIIEHNDRFLFIPLQMKPPKEWLENFNSEDVDLIEMDFNVYSSKITDYRDQLELPAELMDKLPRSFDQIGTIAIVKINDDLQDFKTQIGEAILKTQSNLKTVAMDFGVQGKLRVRKLEILAGEPNTETTHVEYGIKLYLDVAKAYFSPRLSSEHNRITKLIEPGEVVLDMFAGVGPFSIMIAKLSEAKQIFSIDLNRDAIEYLIKNIDMNKVTNIFPMEGDARDMIKNIPKVDRIIMNLPKEAHNYLPTAFVILKAKGIIHYHEILSKSDLPKRKKWLGAVTKENGYNLIQMVENNLGSYSATMDHYCFDLHLEMK
jgi:tRNA (guanine37-N1)-methyltransferase